MRTSTKLITGAILLVFGGAFCFHILLSFKFKRGEFITDKQMMKEEFTRYAIGQPRVIMLDGTIWVNLIPADSFAIELPRVNKDPDAGMFERGIVLNKLQSRNASVAVSFEQHADSLVVTGNSTIPLHRPFSEWYYRRGVPRVNIYAPRFDDVIINNGQVCIRGTKTGAGRPMHLAANNATVWIGLQYSNNRHDLPERFDSLDIISTNSAIVLNSGAVVTQLSAAIKDSSAIYDQFSSLRSAIIHSDSSSRIDLVAGNVKKSQTIVQ